MQHNGKRKKAHRRGILAEYACAAWLVVKGYSILAIRHRNNGGEIDIVAYKRRTLAFIEVKARKDKNEALAAVDAAKRKTLERAALAFVAAHKKYSQHGLRFDVMVVTSQLAIHHLTHAWILGDNG